MVEPTSPDAIVVLEASITHDDSGEIVGSNVWFVNALLEEHLTADEIAGRRAAISLPAHNMLTGKYANRTGIC